MIPFIGAELVVNLVSGQAAPRRALNEDHAFLMAQAPKARPVWHLWPARLVQAFAARRAARRHEEALIQLWEVSPHLLDDIGVVDDPRAVLPDHLVAAPPRVAVHIRAQKAIPVDQTLVILPPSAPAKATEGKGAASDTGFLPAVLSVAQPA